MEPRNAEHWTRLGAFYTLTGEPEKATAPLERAARLNPASARAWLVRAAAEHQRDDPAAQRAALENAVAAAPRDVSVAWEAANFYLAQGDVDTALRHFATVMQTDWKIADATRMAWLATGSLERLEPVLPRRAVVYENLLAAVEERGSGEDAGRAWAALVALRQPLQPATVYGYVRFQMENNRPQDAWRAWNEVAALVPALARYRAGEAGLVNAGFDEPITNLGFDWHVDVGAGAVATLDTTNFAGGRSALRIDVEYAAPAAVRVRQAVVLDCAADAAMAVVAKARTEQLRSASPPEIQVTDGRTGALLGRSAGLEGTRGWHEVVVPFRCPAEAAWVYVALTRPEASRAMQGRLWVDSVRLVR